MAQKKRSRFFQRSSPEIQNLNSETASLLSGKGNKAAKHKFSERMRVGLKTLLKPHIKIEENKKDDTDSTTKDEQEFSPETIFSELLDKRQYYNICVTIYELEETHATNDHVMYQKLIDHMRVTVRAVLQGDISLGEHLKSVAQCMKWAKERSHLHTEEWSPKTWNRKLKELIVEHIKEHLFPFESDAHGKNGITDHLEQLEYSVMKDLERNRSLLGDLFILYLKCLSACMLSHLSSLPVNDLSYEECLLFYRLACQEHWRRCFCMNKSGKYDHLYFITWLQKSVTDANPCAENIVHTSIDDDGLYWVEFLYFLKRCNYILEEKLEKMLSVKGICRSLWTVKSCQILKSTLENVNDVSEDKSAHRLEIMNVIRQNEKLGFKLLTGAMKTNLKKPFEEYFTINNNEFMQILRDFQFSLTCAAIQNETLLQTTYNTIVGLYIVSYLNYCNKIRHLRKTNVFSFGRGPLQEFFTGLHPHAVKPEDPVKSVLHMLTSKDIESLKVTVCFFCNDYQDLREEHLRTILNLNGYLGCKEKAMLMQYIKNRKAAPSEDELCFSQDMEVSCCSLWCCRLLY